MWTKSFFIQKRGSRTNTRVGGLKNDNYGTRKVLEPVAQLEPNFDGIVIRWSSSKIVSGSCALPPRWLPQCSCVVIESSFDPGERLQAPGSLWFSFQKDWLCKRGTTAYECGQNHFSSKKEALGQIQGWGA
jgi:hypothetical protein